MLIPIEDIERAANGLAYLLKKIGEDQRFALNSWWHPEANEVLLATFHKMMEEIKEIKEIKENRHNTAKDKEQKS